MFVEFDLDPRCLNVLTTQGILEPTPIQAEAIPVALEGRDLIGIAQTGTGKTLAFALPALTRLNAARPGKNRMLVLTPTRELAVQVHSVIAPLAKAVGLRSACIYGGVGMQGQTLSLRKGCDIIVATPGRLLDHVDRRNIRFNDLSVLVMDEADRMLDMGFMPAIQSILELLPKERQTMLFSATFPREIERLSQNMLNEPHRIQIGAVSTPTKDVRQAVYTVNPTEKMDLLSKVLKEAQVVSAIVFLRTKHRTDRIARTLQKEGFKVEAIHGGRSQSQRQRAIDGFRKGHFQVLVATDVASRGLDVQGISHVINFDVPNSPDDYIHRIGRTARNNAKGDAVTFVSPEDHLALRSIEAVLGSEIPQIEWEGAVALPVAGRPERNYGPSRNGGRRFGSRPAGRDNQRSDNRGGESRGSYSGTGRSSEGRSAYSDSPRGGSERSGESRPPRNGESRGSYSGNGRNGADRNSDSGARGNGASRSSYAGSRPSSSGTGDWQPRRGPSNGNGNGNGNGESRDRGNDRARTREDSRGSNARGDQGRSYAPRGGAKPAAGKQRRYARSGE